MKRLVISILILTFSISFAISQSTLKIDQSNSSLSILGTSTLHDWEVDVEEFDGYMKTRMDDSENTILEGRMVASVNSFKSFKTSMDNVMHEAMNEEEYPNLTFKYLDMNKPYQKNGKTYTEIKGELSIAGTTKVIALLANIDHSSNQVKLTGKKTFNMSDFNIPPPTAVFGTIKSGDEITIVFNFTFK